MRSNWVRAIVGGELTPWHGAWLCVLSGLLLSMLGIYAIDLGSVSDATGAGPITPSGLVLRQMMYLGVGMLAAMVIAVPHYRYVRLVAWPLMWLIIALLIFLLVPFVPTSLVRPRNGARAWIEFGFVDFQPSEIAKIAFVLVMADYLRFRGSHRTLLGLIPPAIMAFVPAMLITLQPDLGIAMLFAPAIFAMLFAAGARMRHMVSVAGIASAAVAGVVAIALITEPGNFPLLRKHQHARIVGLVQMMQDPTSGAEGVNYQSLRAQMLAGAGQLTGESDAKTRVLHRYNELPERHNDMILSVIMTRFGLLGGLLVIGLYVAWFTGAYLTAALCRDGFGQLVVVGLMAIMFAQTFVNVGMVLGVLPIIGLTLPFVSYGGTSMLTVWLMTGLVFSVAMRRSSRFARPTFEFDDEPISYGEPRPQPKIVPGGGRGRRG
ncbi:MAG: FtsW/RodA/SpoVE family cell cycle protein [Phycisphaerales bacterium]|nr:FtsW/RodA/SpoVE family cell cycle protein [Phycisphaerales bacterium]